MFMPPAFRVEDHDEIRAMVTATGFGHLVAQGAGDGTDRPGLESTPLPVVLRGDDNWTLAGHVARANPIVQCPGPALLIIPGADTYVSPSWYPSKAVDGRVVPTWNYEVVHLHGQLVIQDDPTWLRTQIDELTARYEQSMPDPWSSTNAPVDYIDKMLRGIIGVELIVERVEAKRKLSQNRSEPDRAGVVAGLPASPHPGANEVAEAMRRTLS